MASQTKPIPPGFHTVTVGLSVRDGVRAIEFYKQAFGAVEIAEPLTGPGGIILHAELRIGDSPIMLADEMPQWGNKSPQTLGGTPVTITLHLEDVDAVVRRAVAAGATLLQPVEDQFYGARTGRLMDPFGHAWVIATHKEDVSPQEMKKRASALFGAA